MKNKSSRCLLYAAWCLLVAIHLQAGTSQLYRDPQRRFTIQVPAGWRVETEGDKIHLSCPGARVTVVVMDGGGSSRGLVAFLLEDVRKNWAEVNGVQREEVSFAGRQGASAVYMGRASKRGDDSLGRIVATATGERGYALVSSVTKKEATALRSDLDDLERSFSIGEHGASNSIVDRAAALPSPNPAVELAPAAPSTGQPRNRTLRDIRTVFVEKMQDGLDDYIKAEIAKQMGGRLSVTLNKEQADAVMTGSEDWQKGTKATVTGRWLGLHDTATAAVSLVADSRVLWSAEAGDRSLVFGTMKRGGPRKVADRIVHKLKEAVEKATE